MSKYSIDSFSIGDTVYHLSNTKLKMVAIEVNKNLNEVKCRWIDSSGILHFQDFIPQELGKVNDLRPRIYY